MPGDAFLDTNALVYLYSTEKVKQQKIQALLNSGQNFIIITQVIGEFCNVLLHKLGYTTADVKIAIQDFRANFKIIAISADIIEDALRVKERYQYRFFDSLIIATALSANCAVLYSEDMHDGQTIDNRLLIKNPLL